MNKSRLGSARKTVAALVTAAACTATTLTPNAFANTTASLTNATQVLEWYADPEFGGQYDALVKGYYKAAGLNMKIVQGGANVSYVSMVASGRADFGIAQAYDILEAQDSGMKLVALAAIFQTSPQGLMYHASSPIKSYSDLNGRTLYVTPGSAYWTYIQKKYHIKATVMTYNGSSAEFLAKSTSVQQGYYTNEPYYAKKQGYNVGFKLNSDSGFNPYPDVLFTTESFLKQHPNICKAFVQASMKGWTDYLSSPTAANTYMKSINRDIDVGGEQYEWKTETPFATSGDAKAHVLGYMTYARWNQLYQQLKSIGLVKSSFDVNSVFTTRFLSN